MEDKQEKKSNNPDNGKEQDLRERKEQDLEIAMNYMNPIHSLMDKYYESYRNRSARDVKFKVSDLYAYVETVVPILTNNRVRANVRSDYPDYVRHAMGLNDILDHTYDINNWDYESQDIARMAEIYRSAMAYTGYDGDYKNGTGRLCIKGVNIRWCYLDPAASKFEESSFFFYVEPMRKSKVFKMYPDKKNEIEQSTNKKDSYNNSDTKQRRWFKTMYSSVKNFLIFNKEATEAKGFAVPDMYNELDEQEKHKTSVAFIHYWYRDDNDKWRCSYWADDCFLEDQPNPFAHEKLPYDIYNPTKDILSSMGIPMGEHIEGLNEERNLLLNYILNNAEMHSDPPMMYNTAIGNIKDPQAMREKARNTKMIPVNNPDMVPLSALREYVTPSVMPGYVIDMPERLSVMEDRITGTNDSFRGMSEATSGKETQLKQEAAYTRIKTKIDNFELFNKSIAEKLIVLAMQYYKETRGFRIKGDYTKYSDMMDGQTGTEEEQPFEVKPIEKQKDAEGNPVYDRTQYFLYANPNEWTKLKPEEGEDGVEEERDEASKDGDNDKGKSKDSVEEAFKILQMTVEIEAGSSLPTSRLARREEASELFSAGAIDQESLLEIYDWPEREDIMKRMNEKAQQQAEAQQQAAQAEAQAKAQAEQSKLQQQMQLEQMKLQADMQKTQANNQAKIEQQQVSNKGKVAEQGMENSGNSIIKVLEDIKQQFPELANMPDDELIAVLTGQRQQQPQ